ncbi:MAG: hypothetical protein ACRD8W_30475, partial [Nitrososphaeraceae archaeon]
IGTFYRGDHETRARNPTKCGTVHSDYTFDNDLYCARELHLIHFFSSSLDLPGKPAISISSFGLSASNIFKLVYKCIRGLVHGMMI